MTYDTWKTTNPNDKFLGPEPPPCELPWPKGRPELHCRYPSGHCVVCGAEPHQSCQHEDYEAWEYDQAGPDPDEERERQRDDAAWDKANGGENA